MLIVMNAHAGKGEIDNAVRVVESLGFRAHVMRHLILERGAGWPARRHREAGGVRE